jgi:hypothetical protein
VRDQPQETLGQEERPQSAGHHLAELGR